MRRRLFEFGLFFLIGISLALIVNRLNNSKDRVDWLVSTDSLIRVYVPDTTRIFDSNFHPAGKLYPHTVIFISEKSFTIDSGHIRVQIFGWIWYENIFDVGNEWLVLKDENIRTCNNCIILGRINKNVRLHKIYSPKYRVWNFVSLEALVPIQSLRPIPGTGFFSIIRGNWSYTNIPYLTKNGGSDYRFRDNPTRFDSGFFVPLPFFVFIFFLIYYFRHIKKPQKSERWILRVIDLAGFIYGFELSWFFGF